MTAMVGGVELREPEESVFAVRREEQEAWDRFASAALAVQWDDGSVIDWACWAADKLIEERRKRQPPHVLSGPHAPGCHDPMCGIARRGCLPGCDNYDPRFDGPPNEGTGSG